MIYAASNDMPEEKKRMYYVALTRAMKSEFIIAFDTVAKSNVSKDYQTVTDRIYKNSTSHK